MGQQYDYVKKDGYEFVNPFTFVPYDRNKAEQTRKEARQGENKISGYLDCCLTVKTPLAVPDTEKEGNHSGSKYYPFFSVDMDGEKQYRIPGSSVRGVLRNVYEAVTNSCFSTMRDETRLSKRTEVRDAYKAGLLIRDRQTGSWRLYQAKKYLVPCVNYKKNQEWRYLKEHQIHAEYACKEIAGERTLVKKSDTSFKIHYGDPVDFEVIKGISAYTKRVKDREFPVWNGIAKKLTVCKEWGKKPEAYMFVGEPFLKKHGEEVFQKGDEVRKNEFSPEEIGRAFGLLKESLEIYRNDSINKEYGTTHFGYAGFERAERNGAIPLWYSVKSKKFSLAYAGRTAYDHTLNQIVNQNSPCKSRKNVCKACDLFGMTGDGTGALGSRIRVTDAFYKNKEESVPMISKVTLKELGAPKYSYLNFYSVGRRNGYPAKSYDEDGADIRGRKFYWHYMLNKDGELDKRHYRASEEDLKERTKMKRLGTFDLIEKGSFQFRIYYDDITDTQLQELMWCVTLGENSEDSMLWHKIGHGKPLGLGSCKMTILHRMDRSYRKQGDGFALESCKDASSLTGDMQESDWKKALLKVCNAKAIQKAEIRYPYIYKPKGFACGTNAEASHQWFKKFKEDDKGKDKIKSLPDIMGKDQTLPVYEIKEGKRDTQGWSKRNNRSSR